jgi:hypothetical protein
VFATAIHFHTSPTFAGKARSLPFEWSPEGDPLWWAPALSANIGLVWKCMTVTNTLAYYDTAKITDPKGFIVQAMGHLS